MGKSSRHNELIHDPAVFSMNHFLLHLLIRDIGPSLRGRSVEAIDLVRPLVTIRLGGRPGPEFLVVVLSDPGPFLFRGSVDPLGGVGDSVMKRIYGDGIGEVPELPVDRVVRLGLEKSKHVLSISLHGSSAKIRVEGPDTVIESLTAREGGTSLAEPPPPGESLAALSDKELAAAVTAGRPLHGVEDTLLRAFTGSGGAIDTAALVGFRNGVRDGTQPFYLGTQGRRGRVVPLPASIAGTSAFGDGFLAGPFDSPREACASVGAVLVEDVSPVILERHSAPLGKRAANRQRLIDRLKTELGDAGGFEAERSEANLLAAYQSQVPAGASEIELPDLSTPGKTVTIQLDPTLSINDQITKRFKRAAKLERSREALTRRIDVVEREIRDLQNTLHEADKTTSFPATLRILRTAADQQSLRRPGPRVEQTPPARRYRRFDLDPSWFVLVGRNNRENDTLTFRSAHPDDIWMHAQQTPGSHVVLKSTGGTGNPSRAVLETAAGIAAYFSKARHAGLVPVIYTLRKYVRKFRGARPGQVTCEREKTIFAEPKLPE